MTTLPERRQGIDGLSKRPSLATTHADHKATQGLAAKDHQADKAPSQVKTAPRPGYDTSEAVSHPSLPLAHSHSKSRRTPVFKKLFVYPITQKLDSRVLQLGVVKTLLDYRFWLVTILPFVAISTNRALNSPPAQLASSVKSHMTSGNLTMLTIALGVMLVVVALSMAVQVVSRQTIMAIKIRSIDHRVSRAGLLLRNSSSNILKSWSNGFVNLVSFVAVLGLGLISLYWVNSTNLYWVALGRSYLFAVVLLAFVLALALLLLRRPLQRAMLSTTQMPISSLQTRSWRLVLSSVGLSITAVLLWLVVMCVSLSLSGLILWSMYVYLALPSSILVNGLLWLAGISLLGVVWLFTSLWQAMYFSSFYHILVLRRGKSEISDYLVPHEPMQFRLWPILLAVGLMAFTLLVYILVVTSQYGAISLRGRAIKQMIPNNLSNIVPKIGQH